MPEYGFRCGQCGEFQLTLSMREAVSVAVCPQCGRKAVRVYRPFGVLRQSALLRQRMERGSEPRRVSAAEWRAQAHHHHPAAMQRAHRPWQIGH
ncbi:FmdB family zinc ribbon protein [Alicyclobacillus kakegawensis]|uniref:FmdB family zinc ribbon protein n=1 Tax=Alicyclobacillus kakegawensis TaxID=392012 RepID=UPI000830CB39|nr:FmdB family zinc ribbon protein [Alicyclobacillus kakegawensis]